MKPAGTLLGFSFCMSVVSVLSGCGTLYTVLPAPQLLLKESSEQTLIISNTHGGDIMVEPCSPSGSPLVLPNDSVATLAFTVRVVSDLQKPSGQLFPGWYELAGTAMIIPLETGTDCYLSKGIDAVIRFSGVPVGTAQEVRVSFKGCPDGRGWPDVTAGEATYRIESNQPAGIPIYICPEVQ